MCSKMRRLVCCKAREASSEPFDFDASIPWLLCDSCFFWTNDTGRMENHKLMHSNLKEGKIVCWKVVV